MIRTVTQALHKALVEIQHCQYLMVTYEQSERGKIIELIEILEQLVQDLSAKVNDESGD